MGMTEVDGLSVAVEANASKANSELDSMIVKLGQVSQALMKTTKSLNLDSAFAKESKSINSATKTMANDIIKEFNVTSKDGKAEIRSLFSEISKCIKGVNKEGEIDFLDSAKFTKTSMDIVRQIEKVGSTARNGAEDAKRFLSAFQSGSPMFISDAMKNSLTHDAYNSLLKEFPGRFTTDRTSGFSLDGDYGEWLNSFKGMLPDVSGEQDKFTSFIDTLRMAREEVSKPFVDVNPEEFKGMAIDSVMSKLDNLKNYMENGSTGKTENIFTEFGKGIEKAATAVNGVDLTKIVDLPQILTDFANASQHIETTDFTRVANGLEKIAQVDSSAIMQTADAVKVLATSMGALPDNSNIRITVNDKNSPTASRSKKQSGSSDFSNIGKGKEYNGYDINGEISKTESKLDDLLAKEAKAQAVGYNPDSQGWRSMQYDIAECCNYLDTLYDKLDTFKSKDDVFSGTINAPSDVLYHQQADTDNPVSSYMPDLLPKVQATNSALSEVASTVASVSSEISKAETTTSSWNGIISSLKQKFADLFMVKVPTEEFNWYTTEIAKAEKEMEKLNNTQDKYNAKGIKHNSSTWLGLQYDIEQTKEKLRVYNMELKQLESEGGDFTYAPRKSAEDLSTSLTSGIGKIKSFGAGVVSLLSKVKSLIPGLNGINFSLKNLRSTNVPLTKSLFSVTKMFERMLLRMAMRSTIEGAKEGLQNLAQYSQQVNADMSTLVSGLATLKNGFAVAFAPILNVVVPILSTLINYAVNAANAISHLMAALTGKGTWTKAVAVTKDYASGLSNAAGAAGDAKDAVEDLNNTLGIDELNILDQDKNSGSGGAGGGGAGGTPVSDMFSTEEVSSGFSDFANSLKDMWEKADFTELGKILADKINTAMENIPWDAIKNTANKIAKSIATFLNGFIEEFNWDLLGHTIAEGINTAVGFAKTFITEFHWASLGEAVGNLVNAFIRDTRWGMIAETVAGAINGAISTAYTFLTTVDWGEIGNVIATSLNTFLGSLKWYEAGLTLGEALNAIGQVLVNALTEFNWGELLSGISEFFNGLVSGITKMNEVDSAGIAGVLKTICLAIVGYKAISGIATLVSGFYDVLMPFVTFLVANPIVIGAAALATLAGVMISVSDASARNSELGKYADETGKIADELSRRNDEVERLLINRDELEGAGAAELQMAEDLIEKYFDLAGQYDETGKNQALMKSYVEELCKLSPEYQKYVDTETGLFNAQKGEIDKVTQSLEVYYKKKALEAAFVDAYKAQFEAQKTLDDATKEYTGTIEELNKIYPGLGEELRKTGDAQKFLNQAQIDFENSPHNFTEKYGVVNMKALRTAVDEAKDSTSNLASVYNTALDNVKTSSDDLDYVNKKWVELNTEVSGDGLDAEKTKANYKAIGTAAITGCNEGLSGTPVQSIVDKVNVTSESNKAKTIGESFGKDTVDGFNNGVENNAEKSKSSLDFWMEFNLKTIHDGPFKFGSPSKTMEDFGKDTVDGFNNGISNNKDSSKSPITTWATSVLNWFSGNSDGAVSQETFGTYAKNIVDGFIGGIGSNKGNAQSSVVSFANNIKEWFENPDGTSLVERFKKIGKNILEGVIEGFTDTFAEWTQAMDDWYNNYIAPWFTTKQWSDLYDVIKTAMKQKWDETVGQWITDITSWWAVNVAPWFTLAKWQTLVDSFRVAIKTKWDTTVTQWALDISNWWDSHVAPWFELNKWLQLVDTLRSAIKTKWDATSGQWQNDISIWWNNHVSPWFTLDKWMSLVDNFRQAIKNKWDEMVTNWSSDITSWWAEHVEPWFAPDKWQETAKSIPEKINGAFAEMVTAWAKDISSWWKADVEPWFGPEKWADLGTKAIESLLKGFEAMKNRVTDWFTSLWDSIKSTFDVDDDDDSGSRSSSGNDGSGRDDPIINDLPAYATGGFPEDGLFYANHNELLGGFSGGRTAVVNNGQILAGISSGVETANTGVINAIYEMSKSIVNAIDNKDTTVAIGDREIAKANMRGTKKLGATVIA